MSEKQQSLEDMPESAEEGKFFLDQQMVPVAESIKYRKRAQAAEQQLEQLNEQLRQHQNREEELEQKYQQSHQEKQLTLQLAQRGVVDIEAAMLLAQKQLASDKEATLKSVLDTMQAERPYLFGQEKLDYGYASASAGLRSGKSATASVIKNMAQQAQQSGHRRDMQQYLRLRRTIKV